MSKRVRIAVMVAPASNADERRLGMLLARMIQWAGVVAGRDVEAVLALDETAGDTAGGLTRARGDGVPARATTWRVEPTVGSGNGRHPNVMIPSDGANDFFDCDLWLVVGAPWDVSLPPARPYAVLVSDCAYRYQPELLDAAAWDRLERSGCPLLRGAAVVLVHDPRTAVDVQGFAGVSAGRSLELPVTLPGEQLPSAERPCPEDYILWLPGSIACDRPTDMLGELRHYYQYLGGQLHTVIAGYERQSVAAGASRPAVGEASMDAILRDTVAAHPSLRERVVLAGASSPVDRLAAIQHARVLLHPGRSAWPGLAPLDAAWVGVPILAARDAAMAHLDRSLGLAVTFFERGVAGDLAGVLADLGKTSPPTLPSRQALEEFQWSVRAPALVDTLLHRLADRIPHAYR